VLAVTHVERISVSELRTNLVGNGLGWCGGNTPRVQVAQLCWGRDRIEEYGYRGAVKCLGEF
jgi:hypothetical protein